MPITRYIRLYSPKFNLAYWSSEDFLDQYFLLLKFSEPYSKASGTNAGQWVLSPWRSTMKKVIYAYIRDYVEKYRKLPQGKRSFIINWSNPSAPWLKKVLSENQVVTFPKRNEVEY